MSTAQGRPERRSVGAWVATAVAVLLVLFALIAPNQVSRLTPGAFVRLPLEGILAVGLLLVLPGRTRRVAAGLLGALLGLLTILKIVDMGFHATLARPFDLVLDWALFGAAWDYVAESYGRAAATGVVAALLLVVAAALVGTTLAALRLTNLVVRHHAGAVRAVAALAVVWVACATFGVRVVPGVPFAGRSASALVHEHVLRVQAGVQDREAFAEEVVVDPFRDTPGDRLLTALRGKDVVITFVESYGRDAVEDPEFAPQIGALLDAGDRRLRADGFASRSGFLTSATTGGGSWLAHATLLSGLWIDNGQRHSSLLASDRLTLNGAFRRAGWRTVGVMPAATQPWPEGKFYGYQEFYDAERLAYRGPKFGFAPMPDQYTLSAFERLERARADRAPLMAEIPLVSSHSPWTEIAQLVDWEDVGDGSVFHRTPAERGGASSDVRTGYRRSIEYTLNSLISYVEKYGDDDLVLIFLGDHQPAPVVIGEGASRDVPITIVTRDRAVLDRISGWGWQDGLKPGPQAPVWRMDTFRDRFLTTFGP